MTNLDPGLVAALLHTPVAWILPYLALLSVACNAIDAIFPQPKAGSHWLPLRKIVSFLAWNLGNARNANQPSIATWVVRIMLPVFRDPKSALTAAVLQVINAEQQAAQVTGQPDVQVHVVGDQPPTPAGSAQPAA